MKLEYNTFELEEFLNKLNYVLEDKNQTITIKLTRRPEDDGYSWGCSQEFFEDVMKLVNERERDIQ